MKYQPETDDTLLRNLLVTAGANQQETMPEHEGAEDLFELFLEGKLQGKDLEEFNAYLDANPKARSAAGSYLEFLAEQPLDDSPAMPTASDRPANAGWMQTSKALMSLAMAACLLVAFGLVYWNIGNAQLAENDVYSQAELLVHESQFDDASQLIEEAGASGVDSTRLRLLATRSAMHEARPLDHPGVWSLHDLGYGFDGAIAMGANSQNAPGDLEGAKTILDRAEPTDDRARLAQGWLLLKEYQAADAHTVFSELIDQDKQTDPALLGRGSASYILGGQAFHDAVRDFRAYLQKHPQDSAVRINLAMSLAAANQPEQALAEWKKVDLGELSELAQAEARFAMEELEESTLVTPPEDE